MSTKRHMTADNCVVMHRLAFLCFYAFLAAIATTSSASHFQELTSRDVEKIKRDAASVFPNNSCEVYAFKVDWYNKLVEEKYKLDYKNDTIALIFFTIPYVFNNSFIPFLCQFKEKVVKSSNEKFLRYYMKKVQNKLKKTDGLEIPDEDVMYSFEYVPGHAKILVQTAGHVAGGAYYYRRNDVCPDPWPKNKTIYGVSVHPLYGGYFSLDTVVVLRDVQVPELIPIPPPDVIKTQEERKDLLKIYNDCWQNRKWREIVPVKRKYTAEHMMYGMLYGKEQEKYVRYLIYEHC